MNIEMTCAEELEHRGMERGMEKGMQKGRLEGKQETARSMLDAGLDFRTVQKITGFSEAELNALRP